MAVKLYGMLIGIILLGMQYATALQLNLGDHASIREAASTVAHGMMMYYKGNESGQTPGILPQPYYWWEAGAMFGALIDYWRYTGDTTYNRIVSEAMLWQASTMRDFMPPNQTKAEGNDDQAFWGITALMAAETGFPDPLPEEPQWLALAQAVFNLQASRWDYGTCGGGLRWQIFPFNHGWNYKNSISQGCFFSIAARLGAYTNNQTYYDWADRMYDWTEQIGLISDTYQVFDGTDVEIQCSALDHHVWTYNTGVFLHGSAVMWNKTTGETQQLWRNRTEGFLKAALVFFTGFNNTETNKTIMFEAACERGPPGGDQGCNVDQRSFKAYFSRWLAATTQLAPWTTDTIMPLLRTSALAAAQSCSGGTDGVTCGSKWWVLGWDGQYGVGEQMSALEVIQSSLVARVKGPLSNATGGTSKGDPSAGTGHEGPPPLHDLNPRDRKGAIALTVVLVLAMTGTAWWMAV